MKVLVACKRGTVDPPRNKHGHCLCVHCQEFNRQRWRKAGRTEAKIAWRANNKDRAAAYSKKWREQNAEKRQQIVASWRSRNPNRVAAYNAKAGAKWSRENSGKRNALTRKRVAAKLRRTPPWADLEAIQAVYVRAAAMSRETGIPHEVDHIIPLQGREVSGLHVHWNLQIIPMRLNRSKGNRLMEVIDG